MTFVEFVSLKLKEGREGGDNCSYEMRLRCIFVFHTHRVWAYLNFFCEWTDLQSTWMCFHWIGLGGWGICEWAESLQEKIPLRTRQTHLMKWYRWLQHRFFWFLFELRHRLLILTLSVVFDGCTTSLHWGNVIIFLSWLWCHLFYYDVVLLLLGRPLHIYLLLLTLVLDWHHPLSPLYLRHLRAAPALCESALVADWIFLGFLLVLTTFWSCTSSSSCSI